MKYRSRQAGNHMMPYRPEEKRSKVSLSILVAINSAQLYL